MFDSDRAIFSGVARVFRELANLSRGQIQRQLAYHLWEQAGKPDGRSDEFWFEAGRILDARSV